MKFKDTITGGTLITNNDEVIKQLKKSPERYKEIKPETKKEKK